MRKILFLIFGFFLFICPVFAVNYPEYENYVTDKADIFSAAEKNALNNLISGIQNELTAEIAVLAISSLEGEPIEDYSIKLAEKWKVGKKDTDNGLIILIAKEEREVRIEVGYGLEGIIPDSRAKLIIEKVLVPNFKHGDFYQGLKLAINDIYGFLKKDPSIISKYKSYQNKNSGDLESSLFWLIFVIFIVIKGFISKIKGKKKVAASLFLSFLAALLIYFFISLLAAVIAFVFVNFYLLVSGGRGHSVFMGGGGWHSGGGFGGFGGGGFGGGGASGRF